MASIVSNESDVNEPTPTEDDGNPYPTPHHPRSFFAAVNARHGMRVVQYLLSQVTKAMNVSQEEVLDAAPAPQQLEDGGQLTVDELVEINLGTDEDPCPAFVSATLTPEERESYRTFLMEFRDCFAWTYKEMPGVDPV